MTSWIDEAVREAQRRDMLRDAARRRLIAQARVADRRPGRIYSPAMARAAARITVDASMAWIIVRTSYGAQGLIAWALLPTPPGCCFISSGRIAVLAMWRRTPRRTAHRENRASRRAAGRAKGVVMRRWGLISTALTVVER
jgi:hypothetical protein